MIKRFDSRLCFLLYVTSKRVILKLSHIYAKSWNKKKKINEQCFQSFVLPWQMITLMLKHLQPQQTLNKNNNFTATKAKQAMIKQFWAHSQPFKMWFIYIYCLQGAKKTIAWSNDTYFLLLCSQAWPCTSILFGNYLDEILLGILHEVAWVKSEYRIQKCHLPAYLQES